MSAHKRIARKTVPNERYIRHCAKSVALHVRRRSGRYTLLNADDQVIDGAQGERSPLSLREVEFHLRQYMMRAIPEFARDDWHRVQREFERTL